MAGVNATGQPNTSDYNLGRGALFFAENDSTTGLPKEYRHLGNCPEFNVNVEVETLEHQSSLSGLKVTDKEVVVSQTVGVSLSLDEINFQNLAVFLSGAATEPANTAAGGDLVNVLLNDSVVLGRWYDLRSSDASGGTRLYDITENADLVFGTTAGGSDLVLNTDYTLDLVMGRIFIKSDAANMVDGDDLYMDYTMDTTTPEATIDQVEALTTTTISGSLKFLAQNPTDSDHVTEWQFHQISLKAEGDFSLIGDDWTVMQMTGKAEKNTGTAAGVSGKTLTVRTHAAA